MKTTDGVHSDGSIRRATLQSIGIRWHYWLIPAVFGAAGLGSFGAIRVEPEGSVTLVLCGVVFGAISGMAILWPLLRVREPHGFRFASVRSGPADIAGMLLPTSTVKSRLTIVGASFLGLAGLAIAMLADSDEFRIKGGIAFVFYLGFLFLWFRRDHRRELGILLTENGLLWREVFLSPLLIPWDQLLTAKVYSHRETYNSTPTIGLKLRNLECLDANPGTKRKLTENLKRFDWHLYFHAESLLISVETVEKVIFFYQSNPGARTELGTGAWMNRVSRLDSQSGTLLSTDTTL